ncbi:Panacea domain-containing protein [Lihuaxuella thermophila]|uniref:Uncharacterized phage-associated protein n=1 Tax=Lihuaxuella thermophila TaxID=1173111 RepID=A0A1H8H9X5_9BACL|nr:type II toxin-antitoxin system antitoxin SocA domain-containing protein [Lihuaxuella thermophila]SEN52910.1 Uncharacterized phage-associated protein [Lihuaxuella thermophila]
MASILDVAEYFLSKVDLEAGENMTHLKLQKLCYYAQAWHLAIHDTPLFDEKFQAWAHGPVSPTLYKKYADYKWQPIEIPEYPEYDLSPGQMEFLDDIWNVYGIYDAKYLERLTHQEDPWLNARGNLPEGAYCTNVIDEEDMKRYYREMTED